MDSQPVSEVTYFQAGIKVTKRRFPIHRGSGNVHRPTSFNMHRHASGGAGTPRWSNGGGAATSTATSTVISGPASSSAQHPRITNFDSDDSDDEDEEKNPEYAIRRYYFKALHLGKYAQLKRIFETAQKQPKVARKIFSPIEDDYMISLSNFYTFNSKQEVTRINEDAFKICWLMHVSYWKANKRTPVTYIYVRQSEREQALALGYTELLAFIEDHHIQKNVPETYYRCYGSYLSGGYVNHEKGEKDAILDEYGVEPTTDVFAFTLPKKKTVTATNTSKQPTHRRSKSPVTSPRDSTFHLFSDSPEHDDTTEHLFEEHQKMLQERFGADKTTGVEMDISNLA